MKFAQVIVDVAHSNVDRVYDYKLNENDDIGLGYLVEVPFGHTKTNGFIVGVSNTTACPLDKLKSIIRPVKDYPILNKPQIELAHWMKQQYACLLVHSLRVMIPSQLRGDKVHEKHVKYAVLNFPVNEMDTVLASINKNAKKQIEILKYLAEKKAPVLTTVINKDIGAVSSSINSLAKKGLIRVEDKRQYRTPTESKKKTVDKSVILNEHQQFAIDEILNPNSPNNKFLLHGVTGSGKTEVYMNISAQMLDAGKSVIILVPEISLTPQMVAVFQARFDNNAAVLHSKLSAGEKFDEWERIRKGEAKIIIGARSAIFAPIDNLGLIVIDEEHETSYRSETQPRYDAVEVAEHLCDTANSILVLGSATPTVERYYKCRDGEYELLEMPNRAANAQMPNTYIVDMREEFKHGNKSIISRKLQRQLETTLSRGEKAILFLNRRGYNTFVSCRDCGYVVKCEKCDISMTYHIVDKSLRCHYCGDTIEPPAVCPECGSKYIKFFGGGTQKLEDEIKNMFDGAKVLRMDADTTSRKNSHFEILNEFAKEDSQILIGTQMITKGLDFHDVTLVGVIAADTSLYADDYKAVERTFQLIAQVAGRAGRGQKQGNVIIQTYAPENYAVVHASNHDYHKFYDEEITMRNLALYPPFAYMSRWIFSSEDDEAAEYEANTAHEKIIKDITEAGLNEGVLQLFVSKAKIHKLKGRYRYQLLIKYLPDDSGYGALKLFCSLKNTSVELSHMTLEIDPLNMI